MNNPTSTVASLQAPPTLLEEVLFFPQGKFYLFPKFASRLVIQIPITPLQEDVLLSVGNTYNNSTPSIS